MYSTGMVDIPAGDWISVREAALLKAVTKRTVLNWIGTGLLSARSVDGYWIVLRAEVKSLKPPDRGRPKNKPDPPKGRKKK